MRNFVITSCNTISALVILDTFDAWHKLIMFLFVGIVPGTDIELSPEQMLALVSIFTTIILVNLLSKPVTNLIKTIAVRQNLQNRRLKRA